MDVSTSRGRRFVGGRGSGGTGGGAWGCAVSRSHRAQCGLCVKPSNALGSVDRLRLGWAGPSGAVRPGLDPVRGHMTKSQMIANRASWEYTRGETMAIPPPKRIEMGHVTGFLD